CFHALADSGWQSGANRPARYQPGGFRACTKATPGDAQETHQAATSATEKTAAGDAGSDTGLPEYSDPAVAGERAVQSEFPGNGGRRVHQPEQWSGNQRRRWGAAYA